MDDLVIENFIYTFLKQRFTSINIKSSFTDEEKSKIIHDILYKWNYETLFFRYTLDEVLSKIFQSFIKTNNELIDELLPLILNEYFLVYPIDLSVYFEYKNKIKSILSSIISSKLLVEDIENILKSTELFVCISYMKNECCRGLDPFKNDGKVLHYLLNDDYKTLQKHKNLLEYSFLNIFLNKIGLSLKDIDDYLNKKKDKTPYIIKKFINMIKDSSEILEEINMSYLYSFSYISVYDYLNLISEINKKRSLFYNIFSSDKSFNSLYIPEGTRFYLGNAANYRLTKSYIETPKQIEVNLPDVLNIYNFNKDIDALKADKFVDYDIPSIEEYNSKIYLKSN